MSPPGNRNAQDFPSLSMHFPSMPGSDRRRHGCFVVPPARTGTQTPILDLHSDHPTSGQLFLPSMHKARQSLRWCTIIPAAASSVFLLPLIPAPAYLFPDHQDHKRPARTPPRLRPLASPTTCPASASLQACLVSVRRTGTCALPNSPPKPVLKTTRPPLLMPLGRQRLGRIAAPYAKRGSGAAISAFPISTYKRRAFSAVAAAIPYEVKCAISSAQSARKAGLRQV